MAKKKHEKPCTIKAGGFDNMWLGTTCEDQENADKRIPYLLQTPAFVRIVSAEPLLGPIDFNQDYNDGKWWGDMLDQVIIGAESLGGHPGRECKIEWVRNIVRQCKAAGVAVFVKQIHMWEGYSVSRQRTVYRGVKTGVCQKHVLLKYPKDKYLFPRDLQCWEYPGEGLNHEGSEEREEKI